MIISMALYPNSFEYGVALGDKLDSTAWTRASMELAANTPKGSPFKSSGTNTASSAYIAGDTRPIFVPSLVLLIMEILVTSLPVPQVVGRITSFLLFFAEAGSL